MQLNVLVVENGRMRLSIREQHTNTLISSGFSIYYIAFGGFPGIIIDQRWRTTILRTTDVS